MTAVDKFVYSMVITHFVAIANMSLCPEYVNNPAGEVAILRRVLDAGTPLHYADRYRIISSTIAHFFDGTESQKHDLIYTLQSGQY